jgi:hypothetical protein
MNVIIYKNIKYNYFGLFRDSKNKREYDSNNIIIPFPKEGKNWSDKQQFLKRLKIVQNNISSSEIKNQDCLICGKKSIITKIFKLNKNLWNDGYYHYMFKHNIKPLDIFMDLIYNYNLPKVKSHKIIFRSKTYNIDDLRYVKLDKNQILILDALMKHGGYDKKYIDTINNVYRYSEHMGLLDFSNSKVNKIIISGNTNRIDEGDEEIYLPQNIPDLVDYEYMFHTHPPTPKPGGRAIDGILYELPSISDIFHFINYYNKGKTQGSLVVTPEGLYNIRKKDFDNKKIKINENELYKKLLIIYEDINEDSIDKYGSEFDTYYFYSVIAQDLSYINKLNSLLNKYDLHIDYFPRIHNKNKWIIDSIYLPVYIIN